MDVEAYRYLYYGFSLQDEYSPYGQSKHNDELKKLTGKKELTNADKDKIIELEKKVLDEFPFELRNIYYLANLLEEKGDSVQAQLYSKKLTGIARAIMSTGDGTTDSTAMYVISVGHEYDMLGLLNYPYAGSQSLIHSAHGETDRLALKENNEKIKQCILM